MIKDTIMIWELLMYVAVNIVIAYLIRLLLD